MKKQKLEIEKDPENEIPIKVLEQAILDVAQAAKKLLNSRLKKRAVVVLIKDSSGIPLHIVERVLDHAATLEERYLK